jgi:hypothetical protein
MPYTICNTRVCEPSHMIMGAEVSVWQVISFDGGWTSGSKMRAWQSRPPPRQLATIFQD